MITYQTESFAGCIDEAMPLLEMHWQEIALNRDTVPLAPDMDVYRQLDKDGSMHITTARADGALVGYAAFLIMTHLHYTSLTVADGDIYWLAPEYRKGLVGPKMLMAAEKALGERGVNVITNKVKIAHDVGVLFERMGFDAIERVYAKRIG